MEDLEVVRRDVVNAVSDACVNEPLGEDRLHQTRVWTENKGWDRYVVVLSDGKDLMGSPGSQQGYFSPLALFYCCYPSVMSTPSLGLSCLRL